jgi:small GTP-binding protein
MIGLEYKHSFKFIVIGTSGVGKTCLLKRLVDGRFAGEDVPTIGAEYVSKIEQIDGQPIRLQIWDTAGQEKFRAIAKSYFRHAVGVILVYDITDRRSFDDLSSWLTDVHQLCDPNAAVTLVGNKLDLQDQRAVTNAEAQLFATNHQLTYVEASALDGANVVEAFQRAAKIVYEKAETGMLLTKTTTPQQTLPTAASKDDGCC